MFREFINRKEELAFLEEKFREKKKQLIILYGRRRVGKTKLISEFCKNKKHIYFLADKRGTKENAERFAKKCAEYFKDVPPTANNFDDVFNYINKRTAERTIIAIDEFSYLVEKDRAIPSVFQIICDEIAKDNIFLILCGSSISMMIEGALSYKSPLYGRRTGQWKVNPLKFKEIRKFFPKKKIEEVIEIFSIVGRIPAYINEFQEDKRIENNIKEKILKKGCVLYDEPESLLQQELREPDKYLNILAAMTSTTKLSEIATKAGVPAKDLPKYFKKLKNIELIKRENPITEKKTKKIQYKIKDQFFTFWLKYVYPNKSDLEEENVETVWKLIKKTLNLHVSKAFEEVAEEVLLELNKRKLPFEFEKTGKWWDKEKEIDIVAINKGKKEILFGECKWKERVDAKKVLEELKEKSKHVNWFNEERKEHYALFAKSFKEKIKEKNATLIDLKEIEKIIK